ncbi:unnamed protein product [Anisakis simplex]|uniref:Uncharacterized protein n=1 Tax=Anisakis simplex TaxID=6269 RepID=A0A3P6PGW0_ANISI|nr:unnamed protein product [Anisakis simplex]
MDLYIQEKGYRRVNEYERNGTLRINYVCKEYFQKDIKCNHKMSVIMKDGVLTAKTTDGGKPHEHWRAPMSALNTTEKDITRALHSADVTGIGDGPSTSSEVDKVELELHQIIRHSTQDLLARLKDAYERKKKEQEKAALKLFAKMPSEKQKHLLSKYGCLEE